MAKRRKVHVVFIYPEKAFDRIDDCETVWGVWMVYGVDGRPLTCTSLTVAESHPIFLCTRDQRQLTAVQGNFLRNLTLGLLHEKYSWWKCSDGFVTYIATGLPHPLFFFSFFFSFFVGNSCHPRGVFCLSLLVGVWHYPWQRLETLAALLHILLPPLLLYLVEWSDFHEQYCCIIYT